MSKTSYPLCMRQLHTAVKENHHLKHFGRLQYGLFIKVGNKNNFDKVVKVFMSPSGLINHFVLLSYCRVLDSVWRKHWSFGDQNSQSLLMWIRYFQHLTCILKGWTTIVPLRAYLVISKNYLPTINLLNKCRISLLKLINTSEV